MDGCFYKWCQKQVDLLVHIHDDNSFNASHILKSLLNSDTDNKIETLLL